MKKPVFILPGGLHTVAGTRADVMRWVRSRGHWVFLKTAARDTPYPRLLDTTYKKAPRAREKQPETMELPLD